MEFYVWGCLFDSYLYLLYKSGEGVRPIPAVGNKLRNGKPCSFVYRSQYFICICYGCLISLLKVTNYNVDNVIKNLRKIYDHL